MFIKFLKNHFCAGAEASSDCYWCDDDGNPVEDDRVCRDFVPVAEKAKILERIRPYWGKQRFLWIQRHGGAKLKQPNYKDRWEKDVENGGTVSEKWRAIDAHVWESFKEARAIFRSVHGHDLKHWALEAASRFPANSSFRFTASNTWIAEFKRRHEITSRRINKLVKRTHLATEEELINRIAEFRAKAKELIQKYGADNVYNWDQSGCSYEIVSNRTITQRGEPWTLVSAWSPKNKATHSYTVQYTLSASGTVVGPVYLCLQEPSGRIGPQVQQTLPQVSNVLLTCSKSGKLTTSLIEYYFDQSLVPTVKNNEAEVGLIMDHWSGQVDTHIYSSRFGVNGVPRSEVLTIPKNCTAEWQPLDVAFFRQFKYFLKRITEYVQLHSEDGDERQPIYQRNNIIILQSLLHFQLSAEIFRPLVKYSWFKAGIYGTKEPFLNVKQACFSFSQSSCQIDSCEGNSFVQCARCRKVLCFNCFFHSYHSPDKGCVDVLVTEAHDSQRSCSSVEEE